MFEPLIYLRNTQILILNSIVSLKLYRDVTNNPSQNTFYALPILSQK